jgi:hypothetical protein
MTSPLALSISRAARLALYRELAAIVSTECAKSPAGDDLLVAKALLEASHWAIVEAKMPLAEVDLHLSIAMERLRRLMPVDEFLLRRHELNASDDRGT